MYQTKQNTGYYGLANNPTRHIFRYIVYFLVLVIFKVLQFFRQTCQHLHESCPSLPPAGPAWIGQHGRLVLTYTLNKTLEFNVEQLERTLTSLQARCRVHVLSARIRLDVADAGQKRRPNLRRWLDDRCIAPDTVPWSALNRWMEVLMTRKPLQHVHWDVRFSRRNTGLNSHLLAFLKRWTRRRSFIFTDSILYLQWLQWLQECRPHQWIRRGLHVASAQPVIIWLNLDESLVKQQKAVGLGVGWQPYMDRAFYNLDRVFIQRRRPSVVVLYCQPRTKLPPDWELMEVLALFVDFTDRARRGDNTNPMLEDAPSHTKDTVILRLDLAPWRQDYRWNDFAPLFRLLFASFGVAVLDQCPRPNPPLHPPGSRLAQGYQAQSDFFHWTQVTHFNCVDICVDEWFPDHERHLRTYKFKVHDTRLHLAPESIPWITTQSTPPQSNE